MPVIAKARAMRKRMSPPEARLWVALRRLRARGYHFRRQHPMLGFYPDFVCLDRQLIVEVDGAGQIGGSNRTGGGTRRSRARGSRRCGTTTLRSGTI
ncbi:endonuclease domain-containing protein [Brevundimonas sp.]|uniref:endonuclease domain-containing protein n=1 Tax=Brevundimonas sp. TaxID=1871086 RepID=UPI0039C85475